MSRLKAQREASSFARVIRARRQQLKLTQEELASRIKTSTPYIGHLEAGKRHPSEKVVAKLADALRLDRRELYLLANPETKALISRQASPIMTVSSWEAFRHNQRLRRIYNTTDQEMQLLSEVAMMGEVRSPDDFLFILMTIRMALGRSASLPSR